MRFSQFSGYAYFGIGVALVSALTIVKLTCPVDGGTGYITGADGLRVTDVEYTLDNFATFDTGCAEIYSDFTYTVNVTLVNDRPATTLGALLIKFYDPDAILSAVDIATAITQAAEREETAEEEVIVTGEVSKGGLIAIFRNLPVNTKFIFVELPPNTTMDFQEVINFRGFGYFEVSKFGDAGVTHAISVAPPVDVILCPYSHGTGKVPLTEWLRLKTGI